MFVRFCTLRLLLSSHKNKIRKTELEEKFTDTLNVIEVVSVVETYQSDQNNITFKRYSQRYWNKLRFAVEITGNSIRITL